jgi:RNA polymerase sigma-70 factor (ECF subfamily)
MTINRLTSMAELSSLLRRAREDRWLFEEVATALQPALLGRLERLAAALYLRPEDAEDCLQEALLRAWCHLDSYDAGASSAFTWLLLIGRRALVDRWRARRLRRTVSLWDAEGRLAVEPPAREASPVDVLVARETAERLERALAGLSAEARRIWELRQSTDLSLEEISALLGSRPGTVGSTVFRVKAVLRRALEA